MKRGLGIIGISLIVIMTVSVMAFSWPWQATGKASETIWYGPYKVYDGKPREIQVGNNKYNVAVEEVLDLSTASLNFAGTTLQVSEGLISPVGNLQIKIKEVSNKRGIFSTPFVSFSVAEAEEFTQQEEVVKIYQTSPLTLREYINSYGLQKTADTGNSIYSGLSVHTIESSSKEYGYTFFFGSSWNCVEISQYNYELPWSYTTPAGAGRPMCIGDAYGDDGIGNVCVLVRNHPCTNKDEWVAVYLKDIENDPNAILQSSMDSGNVPAYFHQISIGKVLKTPFTPSYYEYKK